MTYRQLKGMAILLIILGLLMGNTYSLLPGMILALISLLSWYWTQHLLKGVSCTLTIERERAWIGDKIEGELKMWNHQPFPIPSLQCSLEWPGELKMLKGDLIPHYRASRWTFKYTTSLLWFQRVTRPMEIECHKRGEFSFGPVELYTADLFGFQAGKKRIEMNERLIVYPKILPLSIHPLSHQGPFGEKRRESFLYEDPSLFKGIREYRPTDPFSKIEWKATARTDKLMTRMVDASTAIQVALVINTSTSDYIWQMDREVLERTIITASSLLAYLSKKKYSFSIYLNGVVPGSREPAAIPMGTGIKHLHSCIEVLARILPSHHIKVERVLQSTAGRLGDKSQILLLTGSLTEDLKMEIERQRKRGRRMTLILTQHQPKAISSFNIPIYRVREEESWDELQQITLYPINS